MGAPEPERSVRPPRRRRLVVLVSGSGSNLQAIIDACGDGRRAADVVAGFDPDLVGLAGWMRLLTMSFLGWFPDRVVNLHPALPGDLPGTGAIERAWAEALAGTRTTTGVMVHLVPDEGVDDGPVIGTATVTIDTTTGFEAFAALVHATEHRLLVDALSELCTDTADRTEVPA